MFPATVLPLGAQMFIASAWQDITSAVRGNNDTVSITRGYQNEQGDSITPATCIFKLNNRDFRFSNRHPDSVNYKLLPQNTPVRFWLYDTYGNAFAPVNGYPYSYTFGSSTTEYVSTADKAVLDITGDIDVRCDIWPAAMPGGGRTGYMLMSKYNTVGDQRSWALMLEYDRTLRLYWSSAGTVATLLSATSTAAVNFAGGRKAVRATLDVNNGAGGNTVTFYTADTISGSWTMLGSAVVAAGTTSIFSSSANLHVGAIVNSSGGVTSFTSAVIPFQGRCYRAQVYNGIGGTLRADADFGAQDLNAESWSDGLSTPNTWTVNATYGGVTAGPYRFWGEIAELPQKATANVDLYVPVVAADVTRRIGQGQSPIASAMNRYLSRFTTATQWHTLETGVSTSGTTGTVGSAVTAPDARYNDITFGTDADLPGAAGVATFNSADSYVTAYTKTTANATYQSLVFLFQFASVPGSEVVMVSLGSTGTIRRWTISCSATLFILRGYDASGTEVGIGLGSTFGTNVSPTQWILMRLQTHESGGNIIAELAWCKVQDSIVWGFTSTTEFPGTVSGRFTGYNFPANASLNGFKVGNILIAQERILTSDYDFYSAPGGYNEERAAKRAIRIAAAAGIPLIVSGDPEDSVTMGPEPRATGLAILEDCAKVDGGFLTTRRDAPALYFVTYASLLDQEPLALDNTDRPFVGALDPTDDDATLRNKVVLTSPAGQTATSIVTDGAKGSDTVGIYESAYSLNGHADILRYLAQHATYLGTWDEIRLPQFMVQLARGVFADDLAMIEGFRALDIGSVVRGENLPSNFPPGLDLELMVRGYRETMSNKVHDFTIYCQNYGPFRHTNNLSEQSDVPNRAAASNSTVAVGFDDNDTSFTVATPTGALWTTDAGDFPMNVTIDNEIITLSGISGGSSPQTFSVSARGVGNTTARSHLAGADVQVTDAFYASL